jgi:signal transduction histidine kinase
MARRLAALLFAAIFLPTLAMLGFMNFASARTLAAQRASLVTELRDELMAEYVGDGPQGLTTAIRDRVKFNPLGEEVMSYATAQGRVVAGNLPVWPRAANGRTHWLETNLRRTGDRVERPVVLLVTRLPDGSRLLAGHVASGGRELDQANQWAFLLALAIAGPLSLGLVFILLRVIERRVSRIAGIAERVGEGDLSRRVAVGDGDDAFARLGRGFNGMLDKIEALVVELRLVTDGLAHDLRSPITRLQSAIERAAGSVRDDGARAALDAAQHETEALQAMLTTALQISRAEAGIGSERLEPTEVRQMLEDLAEIYGPAAEEQGVALTCSAPAGLIWPLHRELIGQALVNLIENALRHARGGRTIALSAEEVGRDLVLAVADDGVGIAPADYERAQRRFVRFDPARSGTGAGLGLSLVSAAARLHGGRIVLSDNRPGLKVEIVLPVRN